MPLLLFILAVCALLAAVAHISAPSKVPLWVPVFLLAFVVAVLTWPK
jgi:hypothetical protein